MYFNRADPRTLEQELCHILWVGGGGGGGVCKYSGAFLDVGEQIYFNMKND